MHPPRLRAGGGPPTKNADVRADGAHLRERCPRRDLRTFANHLGFGPGAALLQPDRIPMRVISHLLDQAGTQGIGHDVPG